MLTPLLVAVLGCAFFAGRLVLARQAVDDAARTALQSAVIASTAGNAQEMAADTVRAVLEADAGLCASITTATDTSNFVPGGTVTVTVTCRVPFARLAFAGVPGSVTLQATRGGNVEPYRELGP
jgi:Flp pilus assembly protein TadG